MPEPFSFVVKHAGLRVRVVLEQRLPKSRIYRAVFSVHGNRERRSTGERDRRRAQARARDIVCEHIDALGAPARGEGADLAHLCALDVRRARADGRSKRWERQLVRTWRHLCRHLGADTMPGDLTKGRLLAYVAARRGESNGKGGSTRGQTIRTELQALRRGWALAHEDGAAPEPPRSWPKVASDEPDERQAGTYHPPEVLAAWLAAMGGPAHARALVILLTDLRAEEADDLAWTWVQQRGEGAVLRVPAASAKTGKARTVGLAPAAMEALRARAAQTDGPLIAGDFRKAWARARAAIGYAPNITPRDLRHCHATIALDAGAGIHNVRTAMGHTDIATTNRYATSTKALEVGHAVAAAVLGEWDGSDRAVAGVDRVADGLAPAGLDGALVQGGGPMERQLAGRGLAAAPPPRSARPGGGSGGGSDMTAPPDCPTQPAAHAGDAVEMGSGRQDSNLRPSAPKADALPGCATPRGRRPMRASGEVQWLRDAGTVTPLWRTDGQAHGGRVYALERRVDRRGAHGASDTDGRLR